MRCKDGFAFTHYSVAEIYSVLLPVSEFVVRVDAWARTSASRRSQDLTACISTLPFRAMNRTTSSCVGMAGGVIRKVKSGLGIKSANGLVAGNFIRLIYYMGA